mgnify:CR=1 FL=1
MIDRTYNCISCGALNSGSNTECGNCKTKRYEREQTNTNGEERSANTKSADGNDSENREDRGDNV